jgi:hypothetical protein
VKQVKIHDFLARVQLEKLREGIPPWRLVGVSDPTLGLLTPHLELGSSEEWEHRFRGVRPRQISDETIDRFLRTLLSRESGNGDNST